MIDYIIVRLSTDIIQSPEHRNLSLQAALESIVLLKNSPSDSLPLEKPQSICVNI